MKTKVSAAKKAQVSICPPLALAYYLTIGRIRWIEVLLAMPALAGLLFAVILSGCSIQKEPAKRIMVNSGTIGPEYIEVSEPVTVGQLILVRGHYCIVVEN